MKRSSLTPVEKIAIRSAVRQGLQLRNALKRNFLFSKSYMRGFGAGVQSVALMLPFARLTHRSTLAIDRYKKFDRPGKFVTRRIKRTTWVPSDL